MIVVDLDIYMQDEYKLNLILAVRLFSRSCAPGSCRGYSMLHFGACDLGSDAQLPTIRNKQVEEKNTKSQ